ncbi:hypothetical protein [Massilia phosphatilytica]
MVGMIEVLLVLAIAGVIFVYLKTRKIISYLAAVEGRLRELDAKEAEEKGALAGTLRDINAHNIVLMGLLRESPSAAKFTKDFAETYELSSEDDLEVMKTVVRLTKKWAKDNA